ncbi:MAG: serine hydrolase domain-containing protein [Bacteroidota bacterium]
MRSALTLLVFSFVHTAAAQSAMELNRAGRWAEAAEVAVSIAADEAQPLTSRCEAYYSLIYAGLRLGRSGAASEHLAAYDDLCAEALAGSWVEAEVHKLRGEVEPPAPSMDDDWPVAGDPGSLGLDISALAAHENLCERSAANACLIVYQGQIVQEWYGPGYREPMYAMSTTKSVSGLLAGLLVGDGALSVEDPVSRYVPEWAAGAEAGVTVQHLLSMTSGLPDFGPGEIEVGSVEDKEAFVFGLELVADPGRAWAYSNDGAFLLSPLLDRAAEEPIEAYAARRLFAPLGMTNTRLRVYPDGQAWTHADMETTPRDLARIGRLMLQGGRWNGEQIVPEAWVESSIKPSQRLNPDYGLLWWLDVPSGFAARGYLNTNLYVFPDRDLVVVRMQNRQSMSAASYEPAAFRLFTQLVAK